MCVHFLFQAQYDLGYLVKKSFALYSLEQMSHPPQRSTNRNVSLFEVCDWACKNVIEMWDRWMVFWAGKCLTPRTKWKCWEILCRVIAKLFMLCWLRKRRRRKKKNWQCLDVKWVSIHSHTSHYTPLRRRPTVKQSCSTINECEHPAAMRRRETTVQ